MSKDRFSLVSRRVVTPSGVRAARIDIEAGSIIRVGAWSAPDGRCFDAGDRLVFPGLVDTHVHVNEPGRTDWEGFATASRAALSGGVTTIIDMPLNSDPVTTSVEALEAKRRAAEASCTCDYGFWGGFIPGRLDDLGALAASGVSGFKAFMVDSGIPEFPPVDAGDLAGAMPVIAQTGLPLLLHAELPGPIDEARASVRSRMAAGGAGAREHASWAASRPAAAERDAVDLATHLALETGCRIHIVHVSCRDVVERVAAAKLAGVRVTAETCPHYLALDGDAVPAGATEFKCAPPLRGPDDADALWAALGSGVLDLVATDHSPCPPGLKTPDSGDFFAAWGGVASLGLALQVVWTEAARRGPAGSDGRDEEAMALRIARWMSAEPARLAGIDGWKGAIAPGLDADLVVFDSDESFVVDAGSLLFRHPVSPYRGRTLRGRVTDTFLRGNHVFSRAEEVHASNGTWIRPG